MRSRACLPAESHRIVALRLDQWRRPPCGEPSARSRRRERMALPRDARACASVRANAGPSAGLRCIVWCRLRLRLRPRRLRGAAGSATRQRIGAACVVPMFVHLGNADKTRYGRAPTRCMLAGGRSHSHQRPKGAAKRREGKIVASELVVSSGGAKKMFDAIEDVLDDVPSAVQHMAVATLGLSTRARRDGHLRMYSTDRVREGIRIVTFVGNRRARAHARPIRVRRKYRQPAAR
ncbi:hypothetical protein DR63_1448 [Burkholderia thailandensis E264]|nr:hypothetical protein DR63_1448 [Burkholderia thailandensis E264]